MRVLITGADGFVGRNLQLVLKERTDVDVMLFTRQHSSADLFGLLQGTDVVFHLAGVNRPLNPGDFYRGNADLTSILCDGLRRLAQDGRRPTVVFTSSTQAQQDNDYGRSKRQAEDMLRELSNDTGMPVHLFRLPNVFGKWCKPNYNSVVATFCHHVTRDLPISIHDPAVELTLVYVDDVLRTFVQLMDGGSVPQDSEHFAQVHPQYRATVGDIAETLQRFRASRHTLGTERVGTGLMRALYATYVSYLPPSAFSYPVTQHGDARGVFVEMLKTPDCGQFSYFTAHPGITRGGHYHHSKTEKFLVIKGQARFRFRHMQTQETHCLDTSGNQPEIVETVPGWTHDITNIGTEEMVVMLWANEVFDRAHPDTYTCPL